MSSGFTAGIILFSMIAVLVIISNLTGSFVPLTSTNPDSLLSGMIDKFIYGYHIDFSILFIDIDFKMNLFKLLPNIIEDPIKNSLLMLTYIPNIIVIPLLIIMFALFVFTFKSFVPTIAT